MILDTTFIIDLMEGDNDATNKMAQLIKSEEPNFITALTIFELFTGITRSAKPLEEKNKTMNILKNQLIISLDNLSAEKAGEIDGNLIKEGNRIGVIDSMIAGIALTKKEKILTRNLKDFSKIKGLEIEKY